MQIKRGLTPEWTIRTPEGETVWLDPWGSTELAVLDGTHPGVQAHFRNQGGTAVFCLPSLNFCSGRFFCFRQQSLKTACTAAVNITPLILLIISTYKGDLK